MPTHPVPKAAKRDRVKATNLRPSEPASDTVILEIPNAFPIVPAKLDTLLVVDDLPADIPIAARELDVIEIHLNSLLTEIL